MKKQFGQKGFSLIEFMVVLGIISILIAVMYPVISDALRQYGARAAARELTVHFKKAKLEAVKHYRDVYIDFTNVGGANSGYRIFVNVDRDTNSPRQYNSAAGDILLVTNALEKDVRILSTTFPDNQAGYNSRGLPTQIANLNVVLGATGSRTYTLSVAASGNVRIQ